MTNTKVLKEQDDIKALKRLLIDFEVICAVKYSDLHAKLKDETIYKHVANFAQEANFELIYSLTSDAYYFVDSDRYIMASQDHETNFRKSVVRLYKGDSLSIRPMLQFLVFMSEMGASSSVIQAHSVIDLSLIMSRIDADSETVIERLDIIESFPLFKKNKAKSPFDRITNNLGILVSMGFFISNKQGTKYTATGKMGLYWELVDVELERLDYGDTLEEEHTEHEATQESLL